MKKLIIVLFIGFLFSESANAVCWKSWVCDDYGNNCRYEDICNNVLDLPSINVPPIPAIPTIELKPIPVPTIPPIGTTHCEYMLVNGQWRNICK